MAAPSSLSMTLEFDSPRRLRADAAHARQVKDWVRAVLAVEEDTVITVNELRCAEPGCPDVESVIGLLAAGRPTRRFRLLKPLAAITATDIAELVNPVIEP